MKKMLKISGVLVLVLVVVIVVFFAYLSALPAVPKNYINKVETGGDIEAKYLRMGNYEVSYIENGAMQSYEKYEIWYPSEINESNKKYPVVVFVNGTGVVASKYKVLFEHLASYGFIAIGTEEKYAWNGFSAEMCIRTLLKLNENKEVDGYPGNPFYNRIDMDNIGIVGHSQGGVGVINAITDTRHSDIYKTAVLLSPTNEELATALDWDYDASKVSVPILLLSSTGAGDEELVVNLEGLRSIYNHIPATTEKMMVRRNDADHGDMLYFSDGYVTAWLMWKLQGDEEAAKAFIGDSAEIENNKNYQDINKNF
ncbi:MAG: chlorophyllase/cutinase-like alpha/beta fold protein [Anaerorhabdus sp.]